MAGSLKARYGARSRSTSHEPRPLAPRAAPGEERAAQGQEQQHDGGQQRSLGDAIGHGLILPGPVAPERFQVLEIVPGALTGVSGLIGRAEEDDAPGRSLRSGSAA